MSKGWQVREATPAEFGAWGKLRIALWPDEDAVDDVTELRAWIENPDKTALLAIDAQDTAIGFAEIALRHDYVNGTESTPVGFLEGWYVESGWRGRGVGRALIAAGEQWAHAAGCREFASDALLDNAASHAAHRACGFEETERVVYFRKPLAP